MKIYLTQEEANIALSQLFARQIDISKMIKETNNIERITTLSKIHDKIEIVNHKLIQCGAMME